MAPQAAESVMAQNAAAQREPSMEEILASIRRIIEDSDGAKPAEAEIPTAANAQPSRDVEAYREALRDDDADPAPAAAAGVAAAEARVATISRLPAAGPAAPEAPAASAAAAVEPSVPAPEPMASAPGPVEQGPGDDGLLTADDLATSLEPVSSPRGSIISEAASRQVAAAFDELSEALMASRRRSFDEIAEEMIRPMLQEWLDDNLPTLVERLVREEIERVARGPAR